MVYSWGYCLSETLQHDTHIHLRIGGIYFARAKSIFIQIILNAADMEIESKQKCVI